MKNSEVITVLCVAILLGLAVCLALNGLPRIPERRSNNHLDVHTPISEINTETPLPSTLESSPTSSNMLNPSPTPTLTRSEVGNPKGPDIEDVLLLFSSDNPSSFDANFCKLAEFYGLLCKKVDLDRTKLVDGLLRDAMGGYFKLIGVTASSLQRSTHKLTKAEMAILKAAIMSGGAILMVSNIDDKSMSQSLIDLTDGTLFGVTKPQDSHLDWIVSSAAPEVTHVFTNQVITSTNSAPQTDFALIFDPSAMVSPIVSSTDDAGSEYQIFTQLAIGAGSIFLDAGAPGVNIETRQLRDVYYDPAHFSEILPLMFSIRYALGDEVWHSEQNYANLTIDDPALIEPFDKLNFAALLQEMKAHNFHTTIAFIPANWEKSEQDVIRLFLNNPDRFSLVQHGNNHTGYEFYKYNAPASDPYPAIPLSNQEWDILEGLSRMEMLQRNTGVSYDRVMIFPCGISPEATLVLLKKNKYLATVNTQDVPLDATRPLTWDYGMHPANMDYGNFATFTRHHPGTYQPFTPNIQPFIYDLFIGKPVLMYSHASELFSESIRSFSPFVEQLNKLIAGIQWLGLGNMIKRIHLEKGNDDGSIDVWMYANDLILTNGSNESRIYHIQKNENGNVPVSRVTVNGYDHPNIISDGLLTLDIKLQANSSAEIVIYYGDG